jgi:hypothetical protein
MGETLMRQNTEGLSKSLKQQKLEKKLSSKKFMQYSEDFVTLTVLAYLKDNVKNWCIVPEKRGQMLYSALSVQLIVYLMLFCMVSSIAENEQGRYTNEFSHSFAVFYIKFPCAIALHLMLYPEVG